MIPQRDSKCEKCRWYRTIYNTKGIGNWYVYGRCLLGGCNGSQFEPKDGEMDEVDNENTEP